MSSIILNPIKKLKVKLPIIRIMETKEYDENTLRMAWSSHLDYCKSRLKLNLNHKIRLPIVPEDISENIIKFILRKNGDNECKWAKDVDGKGDLVSGSKRYECKCFTSTGPLSYSPTPDWDKICFLDLTNYLDDKLILYECNLKPTDEEWCKIKLNKNQSFTDQCDEKRRPRLTFDGLKKQLGDKLSKVYEGNFESIFTS